MLNKIKQVKRGDLVYLKGELVEIKDKNLVWRSSLTSTDTGDGACELFRVQAIHWVEKQIYKLKSLLNQKAFYCTL